MLSKRNNRVELILNRLAKIIINETDVYWGYIVAHDSDSGLVELKVKDWRDRFDKNVTLKPLHTNVRYLTKVDYLEGVTS